MADNSTDQKKTERKIENDAKLEEEEEIHQSVEEEEEEEEEDDWEKIDHQSQSEEEEEDWEKISDQSEKIDDQSENDVEVEIDEEEQEVKEEEEEEEEGMKIGGEKIDDESEKIDGESEKIDDEKMETDDEEEEEEEEEKKGENRNYWNRDGDHWVYRREGINKADFPSCCSYGPVSIHDPFTWQAAILGPPGSPYEDGVFFLSIDLPPDYPNSPPTIVFKTKVFHPNIDEDGKIYVNILEEEEWKPIQTIESLLLSIYSLLAEPDPVDPTFESCDLFRYDWESYFNKAREWTRIYAM